MLSWSRRKAKAPSPISQMKYFMLADDLPDPYPDLVLVFQPPGGHWRQDFLQVCLGGGEQAVPFMPPGFSQGGIAAAHQPFARVIGVADLGEVLLIEQGQLQRPAISGQDRDVRGLQGGDPPGALQRPQVLHTGFSDHPAVPGEDDFSQPEIIAHFADRGLECRRVGSVPLEQVNADGPAFRVGQQSVLDLHPAALAVPGIPERGQLALRAFHPGGRQVIHRDPALGKMLAGEFLLDLRLLRQQPVHRAVHVIGRRILHAEVSRERRVTGIPPPDGGQFRSRSHRPRHDQRIGDIPLPAGRAEQCAQPEFPRHEVRCGRVPVRQW
jgi:hypothetical protein